MKDLLPVKEAIYEMSLYFNQQPNDERITAYAKALVNYSPDQVIYAFKKVIGSGSAFFPSLAEILGHLKPKDESSKDIGNLSANEIIEAVRVFGYMRLQEALQSLTPLSRQALGDSTAMLQEIANSDIDRLPTMRAQLRDMVIATAEGLKNKKTNSTLNRLGINTDNVLSLKTEMEGLDYSTLLQDGPA